MGCTLSGQRPEYITERVVPRQVYALRKPSHGIATAIASQFRIDASMYEVTQLANLIKRRCQTHAAARPSMGRVVAGLERLGERGGRCS